MKRKFTKAWKLLVVLAVGASVTRAQPSADTQPTEVHAGSRSERLVHSFDFDERAEGNLEDVPKYWEPLRARGFPHYTYGSFDFAVGKGSPPSFYIASEGRNVAYQYAGPNTRVRTNIDYRIEGFIRADRLRAARACLSAHFLDRFGQPIPETLARSRYVGGSRDGDDWVKVALYLPTAPPEAYTIGLVGWVLQERLWRDEVSSIRHIMKTDVRGGAWFDDITIHSLPHARLSTSAPGNVLVPGETQDLLVSLADTMDRDVQADLSIASGDGTLVETHRVPVAQGGPIAAFRVGVDHLPPGFYHARLEVTADGTLIVSRAMAFARLAPLLRETEARGRSFGVVIDESDRTDPRTELSLLTRQGVGSAKLPVWSRFSDVKATEVRSRQTDELLYRLTQDGFALTAVLADPPRALAGEEGAYALSLVELLSSEPSIWEDHLAAVVAPNSSVYRWWQIGRDAVEPLASPGDFALAVRQVRGAMRSYTTMPRLVAPTSSGFDVGVDGLPVEQLSLAIGHQLRPEEFPALFTDLGEHGHDRVSAYVEPLPHDRYLRLPRLADWAQRIIAARHAGADTVFVPQTWRTRHAPTGTVTEPTDGYPILRTVADVLADAMPGPQVPIFGDVRCLAFYSGAGAILALWDPTAPFEGRPHAIQLGQAGYQIDLWGRTRSFGRDEHGRQIVRLSPLPVFVVGAERWLIEFRSAISLTPAEVELGTELARHEIAIANEGGRSFTSDVALRIPETWEVSPRSLSFNIAPRRISRRTLEIRYPHNEPAGVKQILAEITFGHVPYYLEVPLPVKLRMTDLAVWGLAIPEGDDLVLRHIVSNRSSSVLSFRSTANVPGRQRRYRPIANLEPGDTQTIEYRFPRANALAGRHARLVLRELNDGPRVHSLQLRIP